VVYLAKFISKFSDKVNNGLTKLKYQTKINTLSQGKMAVESIYSTFFFAIEGFSTGSPAKAHRLAWKYWVIPSIDKKYNSESIDRAKLVLKNLKENKSVSEEDKEWIQKELKPYFEQSLKKQLNKTIDMIEKIDLLKVEKNIKIYENEKHLLGGKHV